MITKPAHKESHNEKLYTSLNYVPYPAWYSKHITSQRVDRTRQRKLARTRNTNRDDRLGGSNKTIL